VVANEKDPRSVGKYWLRVPKTRASALVAYRPTARFMGSVGFRHQGRAYNDVYNLDVNPDVYGGVSGCNQLRPAVVVQAARAAGAGGGGRQPSPGARTSRTRSRAGSSSWRCAVVALTLIMSVSREVA
jgi:hypothetical protein